MRYVTIEQAAIGGDGTIEYRVVKTRNTLVPRVGAVLTERQVAELIELGIDVTVQPPRKN